MTNVTLIDVTAGRVLGRHVHVETREPEPQTVMEAAGALLEAVESYRRAKIDEEAARQRVAAWWEQVDKRRVALAQARKQEST